MSESLSSRIKADMIAAMRAQDKDRLGVIRMLQAAIKQKEIDQRVTLGDVDIIGVIEKMIKQRADSVTQFLAGHRPELAAKETAEITVLKTYLPTPYSAEELAAIIQQAISETGAKSAQDLGLVLGILKNRIQGRANMADVSRKVKEHLS